jgi:hypothetical protein
MSTGICVDPPLVLNPDTGQRHLPHQALFNLVGD